MNHEVQQYAQQVAAQLRKTGIAVSHVHVDDPEEAAECGREYIRIDLTHAGPVQSLRWADHDGWMTSTWADHYPIQGGEPHPAPAEVAREVASHIHTLSCGGYLKAA